MIPEADRQRFTSDPSYNFEVTIPKDDTYTVEWAAGYNTNTTNLSKITITATDANGNVIAIGTSTSSKYIYDDLSILPQIRLQKLLM